MAHAGAVLYGLRPELVRARRSRLRYGVQVAVPFAPGAPPSSKFWHHGEQCFYSSAGFMPFVLQGQRVEFNASVTHVFRPAWHGQAVSRSTRGGGGSAGCFASTSADYTALCVLQRSDLGCSTSNDRSLLAATMACSPPLHNFTTQTNYTPCLCSVVAVTQACTIELYATDSPTTRFITTADDVAAAPGGLAAYTSSGRGSARHDGPGAQASLSTQSGGPRGYPSSMSSSGSGRSPGSSATAAGAHPTTSGQAATGHLQVRGGLAARGSQGTLPGSGGARAPAAAAGFGASTSSATLLGTGGSRASSMLAGAVQGAARYSGGRSNHAALTQPQAAPMFYSFTGGRYPSSRSNGSADGVSTTAAQPRPLQQPASTTRPAAPAAGATLLLPSPLGPSHSGRAAHQQDYADDMAAEPTAAAAAAVAECGPPSVYKVAELCISLQPDPHPPPPPTNLVTPMALVAVARGPSCTAQPSSCGCTLGARRSLCLRRMRLGRACTPPSSLHTPDVAVPYDSDEIVQDGAREAARPQATNVLMF